MAKRQRTVYEPNYAQTDSTDLCFVLPDGKAWCSMIAKRDDFCQFLALGVISDRAIVPKYYMLALFLDLDDVAITFENHALDITTDEKGVRQFANLFTFATECQRVSSLEDIGKKSHSMSSSTCSHTGTRTSISTVKLNFQTPQTELVKANC